MSPNRLILLLILGVLIFLGVRVYSGGDSSAPPATSSNPTPSVSQAVSDIPECPGCHQGICTTVTAQGAPERRSEMVRLFGGRPEDWVREVQYDNTGYSLCENQWIYATHGARPLQITVPDGSHVSILVPEDRTAHLAGETITATDFRITWGE